jgi:hypothetical protein
MICNRWCIGDIEVEIVKRLFAILFGGMLVLAQFAPAQASPVCKKPTIHCAACGMACCVAKPVTDPQSAPAIPAPVNAQHQTSLLAPAVVLWTLPENPVKMISSDRASPLLAMAAPLYARNCSRLL